MNIILLTKCMGHKASVTLGRGGLLLILLGLLGVLPVLGVTVGYYWGQQNGVLPPEQLHGMWQKEQAVHSEELAKVRKEAEDGLNAMALTVGQLQAHVMRLDAMGARLTEMANLDSGEFDFSATPAQGGPESLNSTATVHIDDFIASIDALSQKIEDRDQQLKILEGLMMSRSLQDEVRPAGRPIKSGWISSYYGMRTDPFSGKQAMHEGMDFAGKEGSEVVAVAAGVVTWADKRYGYGNLVEINHGNGYVTRYGHNKEIHVTEGQPVKKGDVLAAMGSTGRSTGPHVHFEVLQNGRPVDPVKYIKTAHR